MLLCAESSRLPHFSFAKTWCSGAPENSSLPSRLSVAGRKEGSSPAQAQAEGPQQRETVPECPCCHPAFPEREREASSAVAFNAAEEAFYYHS